MPIAVSDEFNKESCGTGYRRRVIDPKDSGDQSSCYIEVTHIYFIVLIIEKIL